MALNFPSSPSNGAIFQGFVYNTSKGVWDSTKDSDTAVTVYANLAALPSSGNVVGDYAFATATKALYIWDGAEWDRVSTGANETPRLTTTPASTLELSSSGATSALTIAAEDPEGFPITYAYDTAPASPNQITNVAENNGTFTFTPSTNTAHAGNFTLRLKATDGISTTSHAVACSLNFSPGLAFKTIYIAHTSGTVREVTGGVDEANAVSLDTLITSTAAHGDLIYLKPAAGGYGHFKITHSTGHDTSSSDPFAQKRIAFCGGGAKPNNIFLWHNHDGTTGRRDHPIFSSSWGASNSAPDPITLTYRQFMFNLTYHRHQTSTTNYECAITRDNKGAGSMLNCIIDLNGGNFSWRYDNTGSTTYKRTFKHCTFLNYGTVMSPYSGSANGVRAIDCAFEDASNRTGDIGLAGTQGQSINFDGWKYDNYTTKNIEITTAIANGTYGHLKDLDDVTSTNTPFNTHMDDN